MSEKHLQQRHQILVIKTSKSVKKRFVAPLETAGHVVTVVAEEADVQKALQSVQFDVIILPDCMKPRVKSFNLHQEIARLQHRRPATFCAGESCKHQPEKDVQFIAAGTTAHDILREVEQWVTQRNPLLA